VLKFGYGEFTTPGITSADGRRYSVSVLRIHDILVCADPCLCLMDPDPDSDPDADPNTDADPDPAIFIIDLQDHNKKLPSSPFKL
jgi:hypothetical protein